VNREIAEFVIYVINEIAHRQAKYPSDVYQILQKTGCIQNYLVQFYDVLHTLGSEYLANDVCAYLKARGASI